MPKTLPAALILFSNDMDSFLPSVEKERKIIEEALEHLDVSNRIKVIARSSVSIEEVFRLFNRYKGRIALFHFAGHADGDGLQFNKAFTDTDHGNAVGLADLFKQEVAEGMLKMVFLNGCSTHPQEEMLKKAGVSTIISTKHPIQDTKALAFAEQFYRCFANSERENPFENLPTVQEAFERATAYLKTTYKVNADQTAKLWDAQSGEEIRDFAGHTSAVSAVAFSSSSPDSIGNGRYVLTGSRDQTAKLWNLYGVEVFSYKGEALPILAVMFSDDDNYVITGVDLFKGGGGKYITPWTFMEERVQPFLLGELKAKGLEFTKEDVLEMKARCGRW